MDLISLEGYNLRNLRLGATPTNLSGVNPGRRQLIIAGTPLTSAGAFLEASLTVVVILQLPTHTGLQPTSRHLPQKQSRQ